MQKLSLSYERMYFMNCKNFNCQFYKKKKNLELSTLQIPRNPIKIERSVERMKFSLILKISSNNIVSQGRIIAAPFFHVGFADFWLADQMNSMATVFTDLHYTTCFYLTHNWLSGGIVLVRISSTKTSTTSTDILAKFFFQIYVQMW